MKRFMLTTPKGLDNFTKAGKWRSSKKSFTSNCSELELRFKKEDSHVNQFEEGGDIVYRVTAKEI
jgi:hypothetical protein